MLVTTQKKVRALVLAQYDELEVKNRCAIAFGMAPVQGVSLHSDVLGQLVFSALDRTVAGSRSADARRAQAEEVFESLYSKLEIADKAGDLLLNDKLSTSDKIKKTVDEFGGKKAAFGYLFNTAAFGYNVLQKRREETKEATATDNYIVDKLKDEFKPADNKSENTIKSFDLLLNAYKDLKERQGAAIKYIAEHFVVDKVFNELIKDVKLSEEEHQKILDNSAFFRTSEEQNNVLVRSILIWMENTLCAFKSLLKAGGCPKPEPEFEADQLTAVDAKIQGLLSAAVPQDVQPDQRPKRQIGRLDKLEQTPASLCNEFLEIYRKDSLATRFLVQEMLKNCPECPAKK